MNVFHPLVTIYIEYGWYDQLVATSKWYSVYIKFISRSYLKEAWEGLPRHVDGALVLRLLQKHFYSSNCNGLFDVGRHFASRSHLYWLEKKYNDLLKKKIKSTRKKTYVFLIDVACDLSVTVVLILLFLFNIIDSRMKEKGTARRRGLALNEDLKFFGWKKNIVVLTCISL